MDDMQTMAEHTFMASWNYVQYKQAKKNILPGDIIMVLDFAQNYLCLHQKEVQGLHWRHKQVTVMPTVVLQRAFFLLCKRPFFCKLLFLVFMQDAPCLVCWFSHSFVSEACACFWGMFVRGCARRDLC